MEEAEEKQTASSAQNSIRKIGLMDASNRSTIIAERAGGAGRRNKDGKEGVLQLQK